MTEPRIVVGVDDSVPARNALVWAMTEGELRGTTVEAVYQYHLPWAPGPLGFSSGPPSEEELQKEATEVVERIVSDVVKNGSWGREPVAKTRFGPSASDILCEEADGASLLVVGQRGSGGFLGLRLGSVSEGCLHHSPTTMVIVPEKTPELGPVKRITVGVDGSEFSPSAIRWAVEEGERLGVDVVALMAWNWLGPPLREMQPVVGWDEDKAADFLADILEKAGASGVQGEVVNAKPAKALVERSEAGDLVVVAAQGMSAARSVVAGSTSRQLAHHAVAPIVVVR